MSSFTRAAADNNDNAIIVVADIIRVNIRTKTTFYRGDIRRFSTVQNGRGCGSAFRSPETTTEKIRKNAI